MRKLAAGLALALGACAHAPGAAMPPRLQMPSLAAEPCALYRLPERATEADLEVGFARRGEELAICEQKRRLAVETAADQQSIANAWLATPKPLFSRFSRRKSGAAAGSHP